MTCHGKGRGGFHRHRRAGETPCPSCKEAEAAYQAAYAKANQAQRTREKKIERRTAARLMDLYPVEAHAIRAEVRAALEAEETQQEERTRK